MTKKESSKSALELTSEQLAITHLKQGNLAGLSVLVQIFQVKAVHAALLIVNDQGTAEEIVQEAFLRAFHKIDQFDDHRPFGPWFLRSVIHAALKVAKSQTRTEPFEESQNGSCTADWLIDPGLDPQEIAEKEEVRVAVWQALEQLTPNQRAAVVLRYFLEEDEQEMIRELNHPLTTIKWWLHSARQRLQQILRSYDGVEPECEEVEHE